MPRPKGKTLTPQDILDVAIILLETQGVEDFSINQLAKALAIKPPSLYNHFAGDENIRRSIRLEGWRRIAEQCLPDIQSNDHPVDLIQRTTTKCREFAIENPALYLFTIQHPFPPSDIEFAPILHHILDVYVTILTPFGLGKEDTLHAARLLHSSVHAERNLGLFYSHRIDGSQLYLDGQSFGRVFLTQASCLNLTGNPQTRLAALRVCY
jgi:AcrR family transcriptional regulator